MYGLLTFGWPVGKPWGVGIDISLLLNDACSKQEIRPLKWHFLPKSWTSVILFNSAGLFSMFSIWYSPTSIYTELEPPSPDNPFITDLQSADVRRCGGSSTRSVTVGQWRIKALGFKVHMSKVPSVVNVSFSRVGYHRNFVCFYFILFSSAF